MIFPIFLKQSLPKFGPNKCPVYPKLPWIGNISLKFENKTTKKILPQRKCKIRSTATHQQCGSAIRLHLMQNPECATQCSNDQFSVLSKARSMFYLSVLEATYIKIRKPILCRQKEFVYFLQIFTNSDVACQQWQRCTVAPLHRCTVAPLHRCTVAPLHRCTVSWRTHDF